VSRSRSRSPRRSGTGPPPTPRAAPEDPQVPVFEMLPAFEEEGSVPFEPGPVARELLDAQSEPGEQCRLLASRLVALGRDKRLRRIGVVGARPGEGTTTVALGLARALSAERRRRVLLLELDLRRPDLDRELGLDPPAAGLRHYLDGRCDVPVLRRSRDGYWILSAGPGSASDVPSAPRLASLLRATDRVFDYVVADCPPLLEGDGEVALQAHLDGFVFVVRSRRAPREAIRRAAARLKPSLIIGLVLNAQRDFLRRRV